MPDSRYVKKQTNKKHKKNKQTNNNKKKTHKKQQKNNNNNNKKKQQQQKNKNKKKKKTNCYLMLKGLDEYGQINWITKVRQLLFSNSFGYIWIEQCVHNFRALLSTFVQRLKDQYLQSWYAELADSSKLCLYKDYKFVVFI